MESLRNSPPKSFADIPIVSLEDYSSSEITQIKTSEKSKLAFPKSNVLLFRLEDDSKLVIRPSGTEPKIKLYCGVENKNPKDLEKEIAKAEKKVEKLLDELKKHLN